MSIRNILNVQLTLDRAPRRDPMDPVLRVALGFALFAATHLALGAPGVRTALVARLGPQGFTLLFSLVAWLTFGFAVSSYAAHAGEGPAGLALGAAAAARLAL